MINDNDVMREVLSRLPIKSLLSCKCVCKWWNFLISDPIFAWNYVNRNPHLFVSGFFLQKLLYLQLYPDLEFVTLDGTIDAAPEASLSFINDEKGVLIQHSCNGLLCCSSSRCHENDRVYYICKPTTKQYTVLPRPMATTVFGINIAFDPSKTLDYKVVCICDSELSSDHCQITVYDSRTISWRLSGSPFLQVEGLLYGRGVFWNGSLHWIGVKETSLRFDAEQELLVEMPSPPLREGWEERRLRYFGESRGHLHLIEIYGPRTTLFDVMELRKDYSGWS
ncbi:PREDICTED: F-box protein At5g07610-like [Nelumbo nucifera]|uniref:F-box protein At5g07610-like n=1 Tax=Nelumbo nucifera TaxID=4432 RepID=A0A1U7ZL76_NELNU|nr:PREDICTED: F-box protein At5g07610-like [Nelumbo nucifera]